MNPSLFEFSLPDGTKADVKTSTGANAFLNAISSFDHYSSTLKVVKKLRKKKKPTRNQEKCLCELIDFIDAIASNADRETFDNKVPESEIRELLSYIIEEMRRLTTNQRWINSGLLNESDAKLVHLSRSLFRHAVPVSMAFEGSFFQDLATFINACQSVERVEPAYLLVSAGTCRIAVSALITAASFNGWSVEKIFKKFEASGYLECILRCSVALKAVENMVDTRADSNFVSMVVGELESCTGLLARKFKRGEPCGDYFWTILESSRNESTLISNVLLTRFKGIANLVEAMDSTEFEAKLASGVCYSCFDENCDQLRSCGRCRFAFYCSKECQEGDWEFHKCNCRKLTTAALDRAFSLRMNIVWFMNQNLQVIHERMHGTGLEPSDLAIEISLMPNESGSIPALEDPPKFKVLPIQDYVSGEFPNRWFQDSWDTTLQRTWLKDVADQIVEGQKSCGGILVVYHGGRIHVDVNTMVECAGAGCFLDDIQMNLGTNFWCSPPVSVCQKYPGLP